MYYSTPNVLTIHDPDYGTATFTMYSNRTTASECTADRATASECTAEREEHTLCYNDYVDEEELEEEEIKPTSKGSCCKSARMHRAPVQQQGDYG